MKSAAFLPVALVLANLSALAISLLVPLLVTADQYSIFALIWSAGQLCASVAYEWMRFGVLRYSVGADEGLATIRRGLLWRGYVLVTAALLAVALLAWLVSLAAPLAFYVAAIAFYAACQGAFEGRQSRARALLDNGFYSASWVIRTFISLVLSALVAWATGSGAAALFGLAASYPITMLVMNRARAIPSLRPAWSREQLRFLARYGFFAALATNISMLLPTVLRSLAISTLGLADAGGLLLAVDLSQKAVSVVGLAVNIIAMQASIRAAEFGSSDDLNRQARLQIAVTTAFVAPAALGFFLIQQPFVDLFVAEEYRQTYWPAIGLASLAAGIFSFRLFAIDSLFIAFGRTAGAVVGPLVSVLVTVLGIFGLAALGEVTPLFITAAFVAGAFAGTLCSAVMLSRIRKIDWPIADFAKVAGGCATMVVAWYLLPREAGLLRLLALLAICGGVYGATELALDMLGIRKIGRKILSKILQRRTIA